MSTGGPASVEQSIRTGRIVAILRMPQLDETSGAALAATLLSAGITALEFTLTCKGALDAVRSARKIVGNDGVVGVGTVLHPGQVDLAAAAGAQFIVSPDVQPNVIARATEQGLPALPGAYTATEVKAAVDHGAAFVKLFPAQPAGPGYLTALRGPFPDVSFVPTGGIAIDDIPAFLRAGAVAVGLGSSLVDGTADLDRVAVRARRARTLADDEHFPG